jgi:hypothetical protein
MNLERMRAELAHTKRSLALPCWFASLVLIGVLFLPSQSFARTCSKAATSDFDGQLHE